MILAVEFGLDSVFLTRDTLLRIFIGAAIVAVYAEVSGFSKWIV